MGTLILGREITTRINQATKQGIEQLRQGTSIEPMLVIITVEGPNSQKMSDVMLHENLACSLGITVKKVIFPPSITEDELISTIEQCNQDNNIHGLLVLLPFPEHINEARVLSFIAKEKELEGLSEEKTLDNLFQGKQISIISSLFAMINPIQYDIFSGKNSLYIEDWIIDSNPVVQRLIELCGTLKIALDIVRSSDLDAKKKTSEADLLLLSIQTVEAIDASYLKSGCVAIDFNPIYTGEVYSEEKGRLVPIMKSCFNIESALNKAKFIAPSTGGIGPVALAHLMKNFLYNYQQMNLRIP